MSIKNDRPFDVQVSSMEPIPQYSWVFDSVHHLIAGHPPDLAVGFFKNPQYGFRNASSREAKFLLGDDAGGRGAEARQSDHRID